MSNYRRPHIPGATIFFTVTLADRTSDLLVREIDALRQATRQTLRERPVDSVAWVVLPDHMHCIWTLPPGDCDYPNRWRVIKSRFSRAMPPIHRRPSQIRRREHGIWQRRYWEHHIRNRADLQSHIAYCWHNPVKHGLVREPAQWPYSSLHRDGGVWGDYARDGAQ